MKLTRLGALCAVGIGVAACADLLGFQDLRQADASAPADAATDVGGDGNACAHTRWPGPPDASSSDPPNNYVLAVKDMYFESTPDGGVSNLGYDLDLRCTTDPQSASCQGTPLVTDGVGGMDNASIQLMQTLTNLQPSLKDTIVNDAIRAGQFTIVMQMYGLRSLSEQSVTSSLKLAVQSSPGMEFGAQPAFQGTDRWLVNVDDTVGDGGTNYPKIFSPAYVTDGTLVATATQPILLRVLIPSVDAISGKSNDVSGLLLVRLQQAVLTAKLVPFGDAGAPALVSGVVVGRWSASDMLAALAPLTVNGSFALCDYLSRGAFQIVKGQVCPLRDINAAGPDDGTAACDALSVAVGFDAIPAQVASNPVTVAPTTTPCSYDAGGCDD